MKAWIYVKRNSQGQLLRESEKLFEEVKALEDNPAGEKIEITAVENTALVNCFPTILEKKKV